MTQSKLIDLGSDWTAQFVEYVTNPRTGDLERRYNVTAPDSTTHRVIVSNSGGDAASQIKRTFNIQ